MLSVSQEVLDALAEWGGDSFAAVRNPAMLCCCLQSCLVPNSIDTRQSLEPTGTACLRFPQPLQMFTMVL